MKSNHDKKNHPKDHPEVTDLKNICDIISNSKESKNVCDVVDKEKPSAQKTPKKP